MSQRTATQPENPNREEVRPLPALKNPVGENWCIRFNNACLAVLGVLPSPSWLHCEAFYLQNSVHGLHPWHQSGFKSGGHGSGFEDWGGGSWVPTFNSLEVCNRALRVSSLEFLFNYPHIT